MCGNSHSQGIVGMGCWENTLEKPFLPFLAKVNIRVNIFSVSGLHLMGNSMFVKHFT